MVQVCVELTVHMCHMYGLQTSAAYMWIKLRFKKKIGVAYVQVRSIDQKLWYIKLAKVKRSLCISEARLSFTE